MAYNVVYVKAADLIQSGKYNNIETYYTNNKSNLVSKTLDMEDQRE